MVVFGAFSLAFINLAYAQSSSSSISTSLSSLSTTVSTSTILSASLSSASPSSSSQDTAPPNQTTFPNPITPPLSSIPRPGVSITDPRHPLPVGSTTLPNYGPAWASAYEKAKAKVAQFSIEEKVNVTTGVGWQRGRCVGNIAAVQDWEGLCLEDAPLGVRFADFVTAFVTGVNAAATFDRKLIRQRGLLMGREFRGKGVQVALGPAMNLARVAQGGRNWEGFGADPYLSGEAAYETILGLQQAGVQACAKHFIANEQEHRRRLSSSNIDDRTTHEVYAHPFLRSVMAGVASFMCSYNQVNGTFACGNDKIMNDLLKREYGYAGYIMSDWAANPFTLSANNGLDMDMAGDVTLGSGTSYWGANLTLAVRDGRVPESRLTDMATRILASYYYLRQDDPSYPDVNFDAFRRDNEQLNLHVNVQADHYKSVRVMGAASTVLLKNVNNTLPLNKPRTMALFGSDAGPGKTGINQFRDQGGNDGTLVMGWGSGTVDLPYLITPYEALQRRAREDSTSFSWLFDDFDRTRAANLARGKSTALVFVNSDSGEQYITVDGNEGDRKNLTAWHEGDALIQAVAAQNQNTIVVVHSVGPLIVEPWIDHPNITAVLWAGAPGQEAGNAITDVLYGDWNPSGRLPYTIAKRVEDYPAQVVRGSGTQITPIPYTEGLEIDYRHFDAKNITPRFEFGFGLSYTTFDYSGLSVTRLPSSTGPDTELEAAWDAGEATPIAPGSSTAFWLHKPLYRVKFTVKNTGSVSGREVPQLYLHMPASAEEPPSILRGFSNINVEPGRSKTVEMALSRYDLSIWDTVAQGWRKPDGKYTFTIGKSSRRGVLHGTLD